MSYIVPFQSVALFENTFKHQINKTNKAVITLRLLGLDSVISIGECGVLRDPRGWVFSEDLGASGSPPQ